MAEQQSWIQSVGQRLNPVSAIRERFSNIRAHPLQGGLSALASLLGTAIGGPLAGQAAGRGLSALFNRHNNAQFQEGANQLLSDTNQIVSNQIWGRVPTLQAKPIGYGGMSGITSPQSSYSHSSPQQSQLAQFLGLNNYQGNSPGQGLPGITSPLPEGQGPTQGASQGSAAGQPGTTLGMANNAPTSSPLGVNGSLGSGAGFASMSQVENMLASGRQRGEFHLTPVHEINQQRAEARRNGQTLAQFLGMSQ